MFECAVPLSHLVSELLSSCPQFYIRNECVVGLRMRKLKTSMKVTRLTITGREGVLKRLDQTVKLRYDSADLIESRALSTLAIPIMAKIGIKGKWYRPSAM